METKLDLIKEELHTKIANTENLLVQKLAKKEDEFNEKLDDLKKFFEISQSRIEQKADERAREITKSNDKIFESLDKLDKFLNPPKIQDVQPPVRAVEPPECSRHEVAT